MTFGCRVGPVGGADGNACSLVPAAEKASDSPMYGTKLTRDDAWAHRWLRLYREVVDLIMEADQTVSQHLHGAATTS